MFVVGFSAKRLPVLPGPREQGVGALLVVGVVDVVGATGSVGAVFLLLRFLLLPVLVLALALRAC